MPAARITAPTIKWSSSTSPRWSRPFQSICHFFGEQPFRTRDESRNVWLLALPSFGESWHNGHHAFPASAVHGLERGQLDLSAAVIRGLEKVKLAWDVKRPDPRQVERRRVATA